MLSLLAICVLPLFRAYAGLIKTVPAPSNTTYTPPNANCVDYEAPITISTQGFNFDAPRWSDNFGLTDFVSVISTRPSANFSAPISVSVDLEGNYTISATFCSPKARNSTSSTVLLLTHGGGYDGRYWNSGFEPETYNFVQFAISQGYSVFNYDRLGIGNSSKLSGFVSQASMHVEVLNELAMRIKAGQYTDNIGVPTKLVLVGHSMGSAYTNSLLVNAPEIADAAVLTGLAFTQDVGTVAESFSLRVAAQQDKAWNELDEGFTTWDSIYNNVNAFFKAPTYDIEAVKYAESVKAPFAILDILTFLAIPFNATQFKGPTLVISGEYDFLLCGGYCPGVNEEPSASNFNGSSAFKADIVPKAGHGLNFHTNAPETYATIFEFLKDHGL
ncbi:MAG: hypothetical protein M1820_004491 [Bogoriella megaspora]|nr:MAG: hypothetical protein M1820_004491 [Bogoriella megaspora]